MGIGAAIWCWSVLSLALALAPSSLLRAGSSARAVDWILMDVENVRGKAGFGCYSHVEFVHTMVQWTKECALDGKVSLVVDHGNCESAVWVENLSVVFAGPEWKADDVIARDYTRFGGDTTVMIVTADNDLMQRCRGARVLAPHKLLEDLKTLTDVPAIFKEEDDGISSTLDPEKIHQLDQEIQLSAQLMQAESMLANISSGSNNKRKMKLQTKVNDLREQLALQSGVLQQVLRDVDRSILSEWERRPATRHEWTGDRMLLAESLRQRCLATDHAMDPITQQRPAAMHVAHINSSTHTPISVRFVVISDTHGYERQLGDLPAGDVLLHLGDFAADEGNVKEALRQFEAWMAAQPFDTKIVVRGNHDPPEWETKEALYVTKCTKVSIKGLDLILLPHSAKISWKSVPTSGDLIASHVPPFGLLDRTLTGEHVGSRTFRRCLDMAVPSLWMCGHIHEARGCLQVGKTMVINAANANEGLAQRLDHAPVAFQVTKRRDEERASIQFLTDLNQEKASALATTAHDFYAQVNQDDTTMELLMAVDLGLNTGISLFSDDGRLQRYTQHTSTSPDSLRDDMSALMNDWEATAELSNQRITRVAVEGSDVVLRNVWIDLVSNDKAVLFVKPEQWRSELLIAKEKSSRITLKTAARAIAKQIVADYGVDGPHQGKIQTDVADSVCTGFYVSRRLGWIVRDTAVRRYSNGRVMTS